MSASSRASTCSAAKTSRRRRKACSSVTPRSVSGATIAPRHGVLTTNPSFSSDAQRLAQRSPADAELPRELRFDDGLARSETALDDRLPQGAQHDRAERLAPDFGELYGSHGFRSRLVTAAQIAAPPVWGGPGRPVLTRHRHTL